jgi:hypothetical protein
MEITAENLNQIMEFDHVIVVHSDGSVTDGPAGIYAPGLYDDELDSTKWELLDGYSGQDSYSGPVMHNSEFIGGRMASDILVEPGTYVAIVAYWPEEDDDDGPYAEGWAVARLKG